MGKVKFIKQSAPLVSNPSPVQHIVNVARTCYQSYDKSTDLTDLQLFKTLAARNHSAMFEHSVLYFKAATYNHQKSPARIMDALAEMLELCRGAVKVHMDEKFMDEQDLILKVNMRTLYEYSGLPLFKDLFLQVIMGSADVKNAFLRRVNAPPTEMFRAFTFRIMTNRGITHELVRHRALSFGQESTRYCDYKETFNIVLDESKYEEIDMEDLCSIFPDLYKDIRVAGGEAAQIARGALPNLFASEIVITTDLEDFKEFCILRDAPAAHPTARALAKLMKESVMAYYADLADQHYHDDKKYKEYSDLVTEVNNWNQDTRSRKADFFDGSLFEAIKNMESIK